MILPTDIYSLTEDGETEDGDVVRNTNEVLFRLQRDHSIANLAVSQLNVMNCNLASHLNGKDKPYSHCVMYFIPSKAHASIFKSHDGGSMSFFLDCEDHVAATALTAELNSLTSKITKMAVASGSLPPERIAQAIMLLDDGTIDYCSSSWDGIVEGKPVFLTTRFRTVLSDEASEIAIAAGQVNPSVAGRPLSCEDLVWDAVRFR